MKNLLSTIGCCLLLTASVFAQPAIWNNYNPGPWGPPLPNGTLASMVPGTLYVNEIDLLPGTSITLGQATTNVISPGTSLSMIGCFYTTTGLVWEASIPLATLSIKDGPVSLQGSNSTYTGTFWFAFAQTGIGTKAASTAGFATGAFPMMMDIINFNVVRWGTSANYVDGEGCPASLGPLTKVPDTVNMPAFWLEQLQQ